MKLRYQILGKESRPNLKLKEVKNFLQTSRGYDDSLVKGLIQIPIDYAEILLAGLLILEKI